MSCVWAMALQDTDMDKGEKIVETIYIKVPMSKCPYYDSRVGCRNRERIINETIKRQNAFSRGEDDREAYNKLEEGLEFFDCDIINCPILIDENVKDCV